MNAFPPLSLPHRESAHSRRDFLARAGGGLGLLAFLDLLEREARGGEQKSLASRIGQPARSIIWCFLDGGPSHIDLFDPKPALTKLDGQPLPSFVQASGDGDGPHGVHAVVGLETTFPATRPIRPVGQRLVSGNRRLRR